MDVHAHNQVPDMFIFCVLPFTVIFHGRLFLMIRNDFTCIYAYILCLSILILLISFTNVLDVLLFYKRFFVVVFFLCVC